jgi:hypothetical protein
VLNAALIFIILICGLVIPIVFLFGLDPLITDFLTAIGFEIAALVVLLALFGPKLVSLFGFSGVATAIANSAKKASRKQVGPASSDSTTAVSREVHLVDNQLASTLKGMQWRDRVEYCRAELTKWQGLLVEETARFDSSAGSEGAADGGLTYSEADGGRTPSKQASLYELPHSYREGSLYAGNVSRREGSLFVADVSRTEGTRAGGNLDVEELV